MKYPLTCAWDGEHFFFWATTHELSGVSPLEIDSLDKNLTAKLKEVFLSQDLVKFEESDFSLSFHNLEKSNLRVENAFKISGLGFIDFITSLRDEVENDFVFSDSINFWKQVSKVLLDTLARGLFYPSLIQKGTNKKSVWELFTQDIFLQKLVSDLSVNMPGLSNQTKSSNFDSREEHNKSAIYSFLRITLDETIRSFLGNFSILKIDPNNANNEPLSESDTSNSIPNVNRRDLNLVLWLKSLSSADTKLDLNAVESSLLEQKIFSWNEALRGKLDEFTPKLMLEVDAPLIKEGEDPFLKPWTLKVSLNSPTTQSNQNAQAVDETQKAEYLDYLYLRELGKLIKILPFFANFFDKGVKTEYGITADQAFEILEKHRKKLEDEKIVVIAPEWWSQTKNSIGVVIKIKSDEGPVDSPFGGSSLVDFSWKLTVGGEELSLDQFETILQEGRSLIYLGGKWIGLDKKEIQDNILKLKSISSSQKFTLFDALRLGVSGISGMSQFDLVRIDADGWIQRILDFGAESDDENKLPEIFHGVLRPYQDLGVSWLNFLTKVGVGGCLADDMGLGKTVQVLALLAKEMMSSDNTSPNLLVVPMSIVGNWEAEAKKFVPTLKVYTHHGASRLTGVPFTKEVSKVDLVITTYSLLYRDYKSFRKIPWYRIILDEAQNIKNTDAKQTKAIRALVDELSRDNVGIDANVENPEEQSLLPNSGRGPLRLALTGTPLENRLQELWSILDFINPGLLGTADDFRKQFVNPIEKSKELTVANTLGRLIKPFILRRTKTDPEIAADLPEKIEIESLVHLTAEQAGLYSATLEQMLPRVRELDGIHRKGIILSVITKLKQICIHPSLALKDGGGLSGRSGKLQVLEELLDTILAQGDKVLIFSQFAQWGEMLTPYLAETFNVEVPFFHGGLNRAEREKIIAKFQSDNGPPILMLSLKAGGFGLNLTNANQVIHMDQWWNPAVQNQATDRAYRIGQKSTVQVRSLISKGTLEEKINKLHKEKLELANTIVGTTRNVITELSPEALEELLSLQTSVLLES